MGEEKIRDQILARYPLFEGQITTPRSRRVIVPPLYPQEFEEFLDFVADELGFDTFHLVIGLDSGDNLEFVYILTKSNIPEDEDEICLLVKQYAPKENPVIKSVTGRYANALWHERELVDLLGAVVEDLPAGLHYPLPDGWPEGNYPLRKDWKVEYFDSMTMTYNPPPAQEEAAAPEEGGAE